MVLCLETITVSREEADWLAVPVVVVSSGASPQEVQAIHQAGAHWFWVKPLELGPLRQLVTTICHQLLDLPRE